MSVNYRIFVEQGPDVGKQFTIPAEGAIAGRRSANDISLEDASVSREHCRFFFKEQTLWVTNMSESNTTLLNGAPVSESAVSGEDKITIGNTVLKVIDGDREAITCATPTPIVLKSVIEIPGYTMLSKLGEGATAVVWLARQDSLDRKVAIKILKRQLSKETETVTSFINEAKAVAKLKSRNIIQVFDIGQHNGTFYFVMEYIEGETLETKIAREGPLDPKKALSIAAEIADALDEAWKHEKIIHRDIKPDNIMLEKDGGIKIADLGLASIIDHNGEPNACSDEIAGTPNYMAPEQCTGKETIDFRSDMYSLGATLYHMTTGITPFDGKDVHAILDAQSTQQLRNPRDITAAISPSCEQMMIKLMMKRPKHRFRDWASVATELHKLAAGKLVVTKVPESAISTIAKQGTLAATSATSARPISSRKAKVAQPKRLKELKKKYSPQRAPAWLRIPLELVLLGWFGWLVFQLLVLPWWMNTHSPTQRPLENSAPIPEAAATAETHKTPEPDTTPGTQTQPKIPTAVTEEPPPAEEAPSIQELTPQIERTILQSLLRGGPKQALQTVEEALPGATTTSELKTFLSSDTLTPAAVAEVLKQTMGKRTTLVLSGTKRYVEVKSVVGLKISADVSVGQGSVSAKRPIAFKVTQLDPAEQSRLLGNPTTPELALAKFVLHMNAGDFINARALAEKCGPLANACIAEADERIKILVE